MNLVPILFLVTTYPRDKDREYFEKTFDVQNTILMNKLHPIFGRKRSSFNMNNKLRSVRSQKPESDVIEISSDDNDSSDIEMIEDGPVPIPKREIISLVSSDEDADTETQKELHIQPNELSIEQLSSSPVQKEETLSPRAKKSKMEEQEDKNKNEPDVNIDSEKNDVDKPIYFDFGDDNDITDNISHVPTRSNEELQVDKTSHNKDIVQDDSKKGSDEEMVVLNTDLETNSHNSSIENEDSCKRQPKIVSKSLDIDDNKLCKYVKVFVKYQHDNCKGLDISDIKTKFSKYDKNADVPLASKYLDMEGKSLWIFETIFR